MKIATTPLNSIVAPALRIAIEEYMKCAASCAAAGQFRLSQQFLRQRDDAEKLLHAIEDE